MSSRFPTNLVRGRGQQLVDAPCRRVVGAKREKPHCPPPMKTGCPGASARRRICSALRGSSSSQSSASAIMPISWPLRRHSTCVSKGLSSTLSLPTSKSVPSRSIANVIRAVGGQSRWSPSCSRASHSGWRSTDAADAWGGSHGGRPRTAWHAAPRIPAW